MARRRLSPTARAFLGGVLAANSLAHLATAATGREHLTPLAGRTSGPVVNAAWGGANLLGGLLLARSAGGPGRRWDERLVAFDAGAATFGAWMALSEGLMRVNSADPSGPRSPTGPASGPTLPLNRSLSPRCSGVGVPASG